MELGRRDSMGSPSVTALLRDLHTRFHVDDRDVSLRSVLPAYERLLRASGPSDDDDSRIAQSLHRIRDVLKSERDLFNMPQAFDDCVDRYFLLSEQEQSNAKTTADSCMPMPMPEALRLLVALSGGDDGETFVLEDPTRRGSHMQSPNDATQLRVGERIHMGNLDAIAQSSQSLLHAKSLPFETDAILCRFDFASFTPENPSHSALWYPETGFVPEEETIAASIPSFPFHDLFHQTHRPNGVPSLVDLDQRRHGQPPVHHAVATTKRPKQFAMDKPFPTTDDNEVFFFDATKVIKAARHFNGDDDDGSVTEASSGDDDGVSWASFVHQPCRPASWEELGDGPMKPQTVGSTTQQKVLCRIVRSLPLSVVLGPVLEIEEEDLVEDAVKVLCGIESVLFRRVVSTASFRLPRKCHIKLRTASTTSLSSVLNELRKAGTAFLRLEFLSVYYSQDPSRGGKTTQALADVLRLYLASYQQRMLTSTSRSLIAVLARTRPMRQQIVQLAEALGCGESQDVVFWKLLSRGGFPSGVGLINLLYSALQRSEQEDATGTMTSVLSWLLVRTASPFVALLSCFIATGQIPLEFDPHSEFRLSIHSTLLGFEDATDHLGDDIDHEIVPDFLQSTCASVLHVGRLQLMLRSILSQSELFPLDHLSLKYELNEAQGVLDQTRDLVQDLASRVDAACLSHTTATAATGTPARRARHSPSKSPRADESNDEWIANKRKRLELKQQAQQSQHKMLDDMIREKHARRTAEADEEKCAVDESEKEQDEKEAARLEHGKQLLLAKYVPLITEAEDRFQYMKWRRDRAVRLSSSKSELLRLYDGESHTWRSAMADPSPAIGNRLAPTSPLKETSEQSVDGGDTVMEEEKTGAEALQQAAVQGTVPTPGHDQLAAAGVAVDDGGLLWRPRIRIRREPGGGGNDAHAALYPDLDQQKGPTHSARNGKAPVAVLTPPRSSTVILGQSGGGSGAAVYESIYGERSLKVDSSGTKQDASGSSSKQEQEKLHRDVSTLHAGDGEDDVVMGDGAPSGLRVDVDMEEPHDGSIHLESPVSEANPLTSADHQERVVEDKQNNPAPALLQFSTTFFQENVTTEDAAILRSVFQQDAEVSIPTPFQSLVRLSLTEPITVIHESLDRMALQAMATKLDVKMHLHWLHRVALMSEGLCMMLFTRDLWMKLRSETRVLLAMPGRLTTMLALAMIEARVGNASSQLPPFAYHVTDEFVSVAATGPALPRMADIVQQITLDYNVSLHLTAILSPCSMADYLGVHRFLLLTRLTEQEVKETWLLWRKSSARTNTSPTTQRRCDLVLHFAQTFLSAFHEAFTSQMLLIRWNELVQRLTDSQSVTQLRVAHEQFAADANACCFLQTDQAKLRELVLELIDCMWSLGCLLRATETYFISSSASSLDAAQSTLHDMATTQSTAMRLLTTQLYHLETNSHHCLRDFAKHFILRLNLNGFYMDTSLVA